MNKTDIKNFAIWARNKLLADIKSKAMLAGITEAGIAEKMPISTPDTEFYDIGTREPVAISGKAIRQRRELVKVLQKTRTLNKNWMICLLQQMPRLK